jgi:hypothetical protein
MDKWLDDESEIPEFRSSLFGFPSQPINVQWVGSIDAIKNTLQAQGWNEPPARDWVSILHRVADISSTQYLPMISPQYQDKKPALIMTRTVPGIKNLLVIRFWDSSRVIAENQQPLWVGIVSIVPRTYSWVFKKHKDAFKLEPKLIFPGKSKQWIYKMVSVSTPDSKRKPQETLLILPNPHAKI